MSTDVITRARARPVEQICHLIGAVLFASGLFHLVVFAVDGGPWEGPVSWRKAVTFGLAFGLTLITIAWVSSYVALGDRARNWILGVFATACVTETTFITMQAWRYVPSHFNNETTFNSVITRILAVGGVALIPPIVLLTIAAFRANPKVAPSMLLAVRAGFVALDVALATGAGMVAKASVVLAGGDQESAYTTAAALKPAHAVTMHAILVLPALAWLLPRYTRLVEEQRVRVVALVSGAYGVVAAAVVLVSVIRVL